MPSHPNDITADQLREEAHAAYISAKRELHAGNTL